MVDESLNRITSELKMAYVAQAKGKLGLARVCARRAVGWAIQASLLANHIDLKTPSALEYIKYYREKDGNQPKVNEVLEHLLIKVEKGSIEEDAYYPLEDVNLVQEAHWLAEQMLGRNIEIR